MDCRGFDDVQRRLTLHEVIAINVVNGEWGSEHVMKLTKHCNNEYINKMIIIYF